MKVTESSSQRVLPPEGTHLARLVTIVDLGSQYSERYDKTSRKVRISFELVDETHVFDEARGEQPFMIDRQYTVNLGKKANLRRDAESWRGKKFVEKDFKDGGFLLDSLIGTAGTVQVVHVESEGKHYANIQSLGSLVKGTKVKKPVSDVYMFDLDEFDEELYNEFPDWLKELIAESPEYTDRDNVTATAEIVK